MKKALKLIFSRFTCVAIAIILQILLWIFIPVLVNSNYPNSLISINVIIAILALLLIVWIINSDMKIEGQLPLIILCILAPALGVVFCALFVRVKIPKKIKKYFKRTIEQTKVANEVDDNYYKNLQSKVDDYYGQFNYLKNTTNLKSYQNTNVTFIDEGKKFFDDLLSELNQAKKFIFMEYFIIEKGKIWDSIHSVLKQKANEGVKVRLMYDDLGTISRLPSNFYKKLRKEGIECVKFNDYSQFTSSLYNNRDHRKITVIDGKIGYMGGINIADEYANINCSYGYWKDSAIKLVGDGVRGLTCILLQLYGIQTGNVENYRDYFVESEEKAQGIVCPFGDGPKFFYGEHIGENLYLNLIGQAKKNIYITTPYLIIDSELRNALINASKRGVDVRIVTPHIPDKKIIFDVTRSNYKPLQNGGIRIFEYKQGFIHSKQMLIDGEIAIVGTINLDYRSMIHHYECGVLMYKTSCIKDISNDFENIFATSIDMKDFKQAWLAKIFCALIKLFTPLF